jgi:hypothetical protein
MFSVHLSLRPPHRNTPSHRRQDWVCCTRHHRPQTSDCCSQDCCSQCNLRTPSTLDQTHLDKTQVEEETHTKPANREMVVEMAELESALSKKMRQNGTD